MIRRLIARYRLQRMVMAARNSPATRDYAKRRKAAILGHMRRKMREDVA